ncbi:MAG: hypothetical protein CPDRYMAC_5569 [uncultured Paraburkholderia sp.]|nr:MAG: hypothetical protein CPDRYDRY_5484 [uncultured Paraburkholderia sp.]CAH2941363.1 MAG: hypothetical protein CPDRYMAC_5569 [uncultured Paraburkholderia sp.]
MRQGAPAATRKDEVSKKREEDAARENGGGLDAVSHYLTFKLDFIKSEMISRANAEYRPAFGLDVRSLRILRVICDMPGITAGVLKEETLVEKTLLSKLIADLIERKLVRRSIHPDDARHYQLWPTAAGKRICVSSDDVGRSVEIKMLSVLTHDKYPDSRRVSAVE